MELRKNSFHFSQDQREILKDALCSFLGEKKKNLDIGAFSDSVSVGAVMTLQDQSFFLNLGLNRAGS